jgi:glutaredoxin-related protein
MRTKEEVVKDQRELKKLVPAHVNLLMDVPAQPKEKAKSQPKPVVPEPTKQTGLQKNPGAAGPKSINVEPVKQPAPTKSQGPTSTMGAETDPVLYVQVTPANPRCGVPALSQRVIEVMRQDPKNGDMFAFTDRWHKTVQVLQNTETGPSLLKKKLEEKADWPFLSDGKKSTTVVLKGAAKVKFLRNIGCPKDLSK